MRKIILTILLIGLSISLGGCKKPIQVTDNALTTAEQTKTGQNTEDQTTEESNSEQQNSDSLDLSKFVNTNWPILLPTKGTLPVLKNIQYDKESNQLCLVYSDKSTVLYPDVPANLVEQVGYELINCMIVKEGMLFANYEATYRYNTEKGLWVTNKGYAYVVADQIIISVNDGKYHYDFATDTLVRYFEREQKLFGNTPIIIDEKVYVNGDYEGLTYYEDDFFTDNPELTLTFEQPKFFEWTDTIGTVWQLVRYEEASGSGVGLLYDSQNIIQTGPSGAKVIIEAMVREYQVNDLGIIYCGYENEAYPTFYSFETNQSYPLIEFGPVKLLAMDEESLYFAMESRLIKLPIANVLNGTKMTSAEISFASNDEQAGENQIIQILPLTGTEKISVNVSSPQLHQIHILDKNDLSTYDVFEGDKPIWNDGIVYYSFMGFLMAYDLDQMSQRITKFKPFPNPFTMIGDRIVYFITYDDMIGYGSADLKDDFIKDVWRPQTKDLYFIKYISQYYSQLAVYDNNAKRLIPIADGFTMETRMTDEGMEYWTDISSNGIECGIWQTYKLEDGVTYEMWEQIDN